MARRLLANALAKPTLAHLPKFLRNGILGDCGSWYPTQDLGLSMLYKGQMDRRYNRVKHLQGSLFRHVKYQAPTIDWDHDHCNGCGAKFAEFDGTDILHEGYVSAVPYEPTPEPEFIAQARKQGKLPVSQPVVDGFTFQWLCPRCFSDFRDALGFRLEPDTPASR